jgi:mevalonate pyrophosphate decarboxylase
MKINLDDFDICIIVMSLQNNLEDLMNQINGMQDCERKERYKFIVDEYKTTLSKLEPHNSLGN